MNKRKGLPVRRIMAAWLCLLLFMGTLPAIAWAEEDAAQTERTSPLDLYSDLPKQAYYLEPLAYLTNIGAIQPDGSGGFAPDQPVTRADLAVWLARSIGLLPAQGSVFKDVPPDSEEAPYIQALYEAGLVRGYEDGTFRGDSPITRAEAAALLARISGKPEASRHASIFADVRETDWFAGAVGALANMKVISGKAKGVFAPRDYLTRAEAAALIHRLLFEVRRIEALDDETVTINGHRYRWDHSLSGLFQSVNRHALIGAAISFENDGDTIVSVKGLDLPHNGAAPDEAYLLDGDNAVIDGNLYVSANAGFILNVHVKGHLVVMPGARDAVFLYHSAVEGNVVILPGKADSPEFLLMLSGTEFGGDVLIYRDTEVIDLDGIGANVSEEDGHIALAKADDAKRTGKVVQALAVYEPDLKYKGSREALEELGRAAVDLDGPKGPVLTNAQDFAKQFEDVVRKALGLENPKAQDSPATEAEEPASGTEEPVPEVEEPAAGTDETAAAAEEPETAAEEPASGTEQPAAPSDRQENGSGNKANADILNVFLIGQTAYQKIISDAINQILNTGLAPGIFPDDPLDGLDLIITLPLYTSPFVDFNPNFDGFSEYWFRDHLDRLNTDQILQQIRENVFQFPGGGAGSVQERASSQEQQNRPARLGLNFVSSANVQVAGESRIEIFDPIHEQVQVTVHGDSDLLEISVVSGGQDGELVIEVTGEVGKIVLLGEFSGEIVLTGTGQVGAVETGEGMPAGQNIRLEGDLQVDTVNGQPASRFAGPATPPSSPESPYVPDPQPAGPPSVTQAVYEAHANFVRFELGTARAAKVYYYAAEQGTSAPSNAEQLKQLASEGQGSRGTANVSGDKAAFTVTGLTEKGKYALYVAAEAPDGTLSDIYVYNFSTTGIEVVEATYSVEPADGGQYLIRFTVKVNSLGGTVYWALLVEHDDNLDPQGIQNVCNTDPSGKCGIAQVDSDSDTVEFAVDVQPPGLPSTYFFYTTVENTMWSDTVYPLIVHVNPE